jgi:hypothetical protein
MERINLDFNFLSFDEREKAINNTIRENGIEHLTYVLCRGDYDIYGWFNFANSPEDMKYWYGIKERYQDTLDSVLQN